MSRAAQRRVRWQLRWDAWYRRVFPAYGVFLFSITHFPWLALPKIPGNDKISHLLAFGLLAFLFWRFAESFERPLAARFAPLATLTLMAWAALDEWTQQFVYRGTEVVDFFADAAGILAVVAALEMRRRMIRARSASE